MAGDGLPHRIMKLRARQVNNRVAWNGHRHILQLDDDDDAATTSTMPVENFVIAGTVVQVQHLENDDDYQLDIDDDGVMTSMLVQKSLTPEIEQVGVEELVHLIAVLLPRARHAGLDLRDRLRRIRRARSDGQRTIPLRVRAPMDGHRRRRQLALESVARSDSK